MFGPGGAAAVPESVWAAMVALLTPAPSSRSRGGSLLQPGAAAALRVLYGPFNAQLAARLRDPGFLWLDEAGVA